MTFPPSNTEVLLEKLNFHLFEEKILYYVVHVLRRQGPYYDFIQFVPPKPLLFSLSFFPVSMCVLPALSVDSFNLIFLNLIRLRLSRLLE